MGSFFKDFFFEFFKVSVLKIQSLCFENSKIVKSKKKGMLYGACSVIGELPTTQTTRLADIFVNTNVELTGSMWRDAMEDCSAL